MRRVESVIAYVKVTWSCAEPGCGESQVEINPPVTPLWSPVGWVRRVTNGTHLCPHHAQKYDASRRSR